MKLATMTMDNYVSSLQCISTIITRVLTKHMTYLKTSNILCIYTTGHLYSLVARRILVWFYICVTPINYYYS